VTVDHDRRSFNTTVYIQGNPGTKLNQSVCGSPTSTSLFGGLRSLKGYSKIFHEAAEILILALSAADKALAGQAEKVLTGHKTTPPTQPFFFCSFLSSLPEKIENF